MTQIAARRGPRTFLASVAVGLALSIAGCGGGDDAPASGNSGTQSSAPRAAGALSPTFVGITAPEVLPATDHDVEQALDAQAKAGIKLFRQPFLWQEIEPEEGSFDFSRYDRLVLTAAKYGIEVMPIVFGTPPREAAPKKPGAKITDTTAIPPRSDKRFAKFAAKLVRRYGHGGALWTENPDAKALPVTAWQVWNEPNLPAYWGGQPDAAEYTALLKTTATAIRADDPKAEILTGGIPNSRIGQSLLSFVQGMMKAGAAGSFDTLAVHPYAASASAVLTGAKEARDIAMKAGAGDIGVWITEIGWATGGPESSFTVTPDEQASLVADLLTQAGAQAKALKLRGVVYYAWRDSPRYEGGEDFWGLYTGLVTRENAVKPALSSFATAAKALQ
ncbi:MAG: beta-galactosidase [Solirubrobacteraceae bacterium]|nr:beta-galactosidase [Solirubrobacteraceae bacterium]